MNIPQLEAFYALWSQHTSHGIVISVLKQCVDSARLPENRLLEAPERHMHCFVSSVKGKTRVFRPKLALRLVWVHKTTDNVTYSFYYCIHHAFVRLWTAHEKSASYQVLDCSCAAAVLLLVSTGCYKSDIDPPHGAQESRHFLCLSYFRTSLTSGY